jgi:hypothetical protein
MAGAPARPALESGGRRSSRARRLVFTGVAERGGSPFAIVSGAAAPRARWRGAAGALGSSDHLEVVAVEVAFFHEGVGVEAAAELELEGLLPAVPLGETRSVGGTE